MSLVLGSWKEIAQYLGKGTRTVQRWEKELGLPVRRPPGKPANTIWALKDEIDAWLKTSRSSTPGNNELEMLRHQVELLKTENRLLREAIESRLSTCFTTNTLAATFSRR